MSEDQAALIHKAERILSAFSLLKIAINTVIYTGIMVLFFLILRMELEMITISIVFVMLAIYFFLKDYILYRQAKGAINRQFAFMQKRHHNLSLYIPIMGKNGWMIYLKRAAIYIAAEELYLEAFDQEAFRSEPKQTISLKLGEDFQIFSLIIDKKRPFYHVAAAIKGQNYAFILPEHERIVDFIQTKIKTEEKEVE